MPRGAASLDEIIQSAVRPIMSRLSAAIAQTVARMVARELDAKLRGRARTARAARGRAAARASEITRWVADRRARRVPTFVIQATGLDTKKKIVAKFGANAVFEKGKALPSPKTDAVNADVTPAKAKRAVKAKAPASPATAARVVQARPPVIRRAAAK